MYLRLFALLVALLVVKETNKFFNGAVCVVISWETVAPWVCIVFGHCCCFCCAFSWPFSWACCWAFWCSSMMPNVCEMPLSSWAFTSWKMVVEFFRILYHSDFTWNQFWGIQKCNQNWQRLNMHKKLMTDINFNVKNVTKSSILKAILSRIAAFVTVKTIQDKTRTSMEVAVKMVNWRT